MISLDELKKLKEKIFDNNISKEEKEQIINQINKEIESILEDFESESDPIDE